MIEITLFWELKITLKVLRIFSSKQADAKHLRYLSKSLRLIVALESSSLFTHRGRGLGDMGGSEGKNDKRRFVKILSQITDKIAK